MLRRSPGVTAVAVLSLALGIGANTAIFTLIESTLLRPIPVKNIDRLRLLTWREQDGGWTAPNLGYLSAAFGTIYEQGETADGGIMHTDFSPPVYQALLNNNTVFQSMFTFRELGRVTAIVDGNAEAVSCFGVSGNFYKSIAVTPIIGRAIGPDNDAETQNNHVALISYQYWTRRFARRPFVIGQKITLNDVPVTIIGVNPEYFTGIEPGANFDIWTPVSLSSDVIGRAFFDQPRAWQIPAMGILKPGITDQHAQSELEALFQSAVDANHYPLAGMLKDPAKRPRFILQSASRGVDYLAQRYDRMMEALLGLAGLVLLIACANVANLLLAKSAARQREISLRLALGAGRWRVARQLLTEGLLLALMAGAAGLALGYWTRNGIPALLTTPWRPSVFDTAFDPRVMLVSIGITVLTGVLFSLAPMWQSRRVEVNEALKDGSRGTASLSKLRIGRLLVAFQVALCVLLLAGAGLCAKTFTNLRGVPLGFRPEGLLLFSIDPPKVRYPADRIGAMLTELQARLEAIPGVESASFLRGGVGNPVGPRFFETMRIPILRGRALGEHDLQNQAVVNEAFARRYFPAEDPVGRTYVATDNTAYQIVGICSDWHMDRLRDPVQPVIYTLVRSTESHDDTAVHRPSSPVTFEVRVTGSEAAVLNQIRPAVHGLDSALAVTDLRTGVQQIDNGFAQERLMTALAAVFGALALVLATIGIHGVMAYAVARRTGEIGIRVALGAQPARVAWMVLRETLALAAVGLAIGVPAVFALSPMVDHFLAPGWQHTFAYGTRPDDPGTIVFVVLTLAAVGAIAGYLPSRRAARVDPVIALRHE